MPRPKKLRFVSDYPAIGAFVPQGTPITGQVMLTVEELEAIRLSDFECMDQETAANFMKVSRQTYGRILTRARGIVSKALVTGKTLKIAGGNYAMHGQGRCRYQRRGPMGFKRKEVSNMPRGDGTGPEGQGRRTGRGQGPCGRNSQNSQDQGGKGGRRGTGRGKGGGGGRGQGQGRGLGQGKGNTKIE